jgi:hypothetical protein
MARSLWEDSSLRAAASAIAQQAINTGQVTAPTTPIAATCFPEADQDQPPPIECSSMRNIWLLGPSNNPDWFGLLIKKLIGIAATVIAIGQGAPFWFDLIRRLVRPSA